MVRIFLLNDTKLNNKKKFLTPGFITIRKDRENNGNRGGGVAILVKSNINFTQVDFQSENTEAIGIRLDNNLIIASMYAPNQNLTLGQLNSIFNKHNKILVIGDLNAKHNLWHCNKSNKNGKTLFE